MPNRVLDNDELAKANDLLERIKRDLESLANGDTELLFAYRRKVFKMLIYQERSSPMFRRKLKACKMIEQNGLCAKCGKPLPERYTVLDRNKATDGYTIENTQLICEKCDRELQAQRGYA